VRVISKKTLRVFWDDPKTPADAKTLLTTWYKGVLVATWRNFAELRQTFNSADQVGDCVVFNVGGNKYRVVGRVRYARQSMQGVVYILKVMTHAEYDEHKWPDECGCHTRPTPKDKKAKKPAGSSRPTRRPKKQGK
jgi:mRNA interferase HigB